MINSFVTLHAILRRCWMSVPFYHWVFFLNYNFLSFFFKRYYHNARVYVCLCVCECVCVCLRGGRIGRCGVGNGGRSNLSAISFRPVKERKYQMLWESFCRPISLRTFLLPRFIFFFNSLSLSLSSISPTTFCFVFSVYFFLDYQKKLNDSEYRGHIWSSLRF